jgi:hypothetical protein
VVSAAVSFQSDCHAFRDRVDVVVLIDLTVWSLPAQARRNAVATAGARHCLRCQRRRATSSLSLPQLASASASW